MTNSTLTHEEEQSIRDYLDAHPNLPAGLGTEEAACSIASINLALTGELTDKIPACMSPVIGKWIIRVQDAMPASMRQSVEWRMLLPLAAGTGRDKEEERRQIILDWMWESVLPSVQPIADRRGFGAAWKTMTTERTYAATAAAAYAADAATAATAAAAYAAAATAAAAYAADAATAAAAYAADAATAAADARLAAWTAFNPVALLQKLIEA